MVKKINNESVPEKEDSVVKATITFDKDSAKGTYHRFKVSSPDGLVGTVYIPKGMDIPDKIILRVKTPKSE